MASATPDPDFWSGKSVAVTGGGGFLGRPTVALLDELGAEVRTIRSADFDLRDRAACFEALEGAQVVVHLAANVGGIGYNRRNPGPLAHDNLAMGLNVFEACREQGTRSWSRPARCARTRSSPRSRSPRTTSGTGIRRSRTRPTGWRRRCCSSSATRTGA